MTNEIFPKLKGKRTIIASKCVIGLGFGVFISTMAGIVFDSSIIEKMEGWQVLIALSIFMVGCGFLFAYLRTITTGPILETNEE